MDMAKARVMFERFPFDPVLYSAEIQGFVRADVVMTDAYQTDDSPETVQRADSVLASYRGAL